MTSKVSPIVWAISGLFLVFIGLVLGRIISIGDLRLGILFFGGIIGVLLLAVPKTVIWLCIISTYLVCGPIVYNTNGGLASIWWGAYVLGGLLFFPAFFQLTSNTKNNMNIYLGIEMPICIFALVFIVSSLINWVDPMQLLVAVKVWLLLAGVFLYLALTPLDEVTIFHWLMIIFSIALIQMIPVLYQSFFVKAHLVAMGASTSSADTVVGTFGGSPTSGGMTGALAAFLVFNLMLLLAFLKYNLVPKRRWLYLTLLIMPMLFIEVKALFIYLPVALFILYKDLVFRDPLRFLLMSFAVFGGLVAMLFIYQVYHWSGKSGDVTQNLSKMFAYSFQESAGQGKQEEGVMTRVEVITFWWDKQTLLNPSPLLLGHGPSASKTGGIEKGAIAQRYAPREIDRTGLALILWDFGIFGLAVLLWLLWRMYRLASTLVDRLADVRLKALAHGLQSIVPLFFLSMLYRNDLPYAPPMMLSFMLVLGLLVWLARQVQPQTQSYQTITTKVL